MIVEMLSTWFQTNFYLLKTNEGVDVDFKCDEASYYKNGVLNVDLDPDAAAMQCSLCPLSQPKQQPAK